MSRRTRLWVVWAARDARRRWIQVLSIALLVALGTGMYSAMSSMSRWRVASADASYALLRMHDLRVALTDASYARQGSLLAAIRRIPDRKYVQAAEERLVQPTQVDASRGRTSIIVPGRMVGVRSGAAVDRTAIDSGRALTPADNGRPVVTLERNFASHYGLPAHGTLRLSGHRTVAYVGQVYAPEYFIVTAPGADFGAESSFAVLFTSLQTVQRMSGEPGRVNELVIRAPDARLAQIESQLTSALHATVPGTGFTFTRRHAERAVETGSPDELVALLTQRVEDEVRERFGRVMELKAGANGDINANRAYVEAMLDLQVWSHGLFQTTRASAHGHEHGHVHAD